MNVEWDAVAGELERLGPRPTYVDVQRVGRRLLEICEDGAIGPLGQARIALASSFTIDPVAAALAVECCRTGISPQVYVDGFSTFTPHILNPSSPLHAFDPDVLFLAAELDSLVPNTGDRPPDEVVDELKLRTEELVEAWKTTSNGLLVVHDFPTPIRFPFEIVASDQYPHDEVNRWLHQRYADDSQVHVLAFDRLCAYHGKASTTNPKLWLLGSMRISESFMPLVAAAYLAYVKAARGLTRKCLVVDLDDTLWGGVVGEDGIEGIRLAEHGIGSEYRELQHTILALRDRGIVLAISSKNEPEDALAVLRNHPSMLLRPEHFAAIRINWEDKATNLQAIARELNIGLDSLAFLDTNPAERAWVRAALPEVLVIETPDDPTLVSRVLAEVTDFESLALTDEDRRRSQLYASERRRRELEAETADYESFLRRLDILLRIGGLHPNDVSRVGQLTRRTNQFNMTSRRYSDADIAAFENEGTDVYTLRQEDVFGDAGLVGVIVLRHGQSSSEIDTFLMSCRVLGRGIETAFLTEVLAVAQADGVARVRATFVPTPKNRRAKGFYPEFGFSRVEDVDGSEMFELDLLEWQPVRPEWFKIEFSDSPDQEIAVADR